MELSQGDKTFEVRSAAAQLRSASRRLILIWLVMGAILAIPEYMLFRYNLLFKAKGMIELFGLAAYDLTGFAIMFLIGVIAYTKLCNDTSKVQLIWHTCFWVFLSAVSLPILGHLGLDAGWLGINWFYLVIGIAAIGGIPFGCVRSADWLGKYQQVLDDRSRLVYILKKLDDDRAESVILSDWHKECDLASAAIKKNFGRNHVSDQYAFKASEVMAALLSPSGPCGTLAERTVRMAEFRRKVEAGEAVS